MASNLRTFSAEQPPRTVFVIPLSLHFVPERALVHVDTLPAALVGGVRLTTRESVFFGAETKGLMK